MSLRRAVRSQGAGWLGCAFALLVSLALPHAATAATKTSTGSASWNTSGTWSPSGAPGAGDSVVIANGHNVTLNTNGTCGVLNVVGTLTFDATAGRNLTITTSSGMTGNVRVSGEFNLGNNGSGTGQYATILGSFYCTNLLTNNGSASHLDFTGTGTKTISNSDNFGTIVVNSSTLTLNAATNLSVIYDLTVSAGTLNLSTYTATRVSAGGTLAVADGATLKFGGTNGIPGNYSTHTFGASSTIEYAGTNQTVANESFGNLALSGSGTKTLPGTGPSIAGNLSLSGTCSATAARALTIPGDVTIGSGCTLNASSFAHSFGGDFTNNGTFTGSTSTVTFTGAASNTASGSGTTTFNLLEIDKGTSYSNVMEFQNVITMASNGLTLTNGTFKLSSSSTITPITADLTTAPYRLPSTAGIWVNGGTVSVTSDLTAAGLVRVSAGTLSIGDAADERFLSSWATLIIEGGAFNIAGRFTRRTTGEGHYFTMSAGTLTVPTSSSSNGTYGPFTLDDTGSTFTMSGGTIVIHRAGAASADYTNLAGTSTVTGGTLQIGDATTPTSQTIKINSNVPIGNLTVNSTNSPTAQLVTNALTVVENVTISGGTLNANSLGLAVGGDWTNNSGTSAFTPGTSTTTFNGSAGQAIGGTSATTFSTLTLNSPGSTATLGANATINSNLNVTAGTLDLGSYTANRASGGGTITVSNLATLKIGGTNGFPSNYTTATLGATSTVEFSGTTQAVAVKGYGHLAISGSGTKTLAGTTTPAGDLTVSAGTFDLSTYTVNRSSGGGTLTVSNGAALKIGGTNGFPSNYTTATLGATSTVEYAGSTQSVGGKTYGHLLVSAAGTKTLAATATVGGDLTISAGALDLGSFTANRSSSGGTLAVSNGATLAIGGTGGLPSNFTTVTLGATSTVNYTGTAQSLGAATYGHLGISGGSTKTLAGNANVAGTLTLTSGNIATGAYTFAITSTGSVSRTSGHVVGNFKKNVATGATSRTFEIGDATYYTPVAVSFASVSVAGDLTASTAAGDHANIATSTILPTRSVNRTWSLTNSGVTFTTYSATFTFVAGDVDGGATTSSFIVGKYSGGAWTYPTVGTLAATSSQVTGVTSFSDFEIGELTVYSVATSSSAFAFGTTPVNTWQTPQSSTLTNDGNIAANLVGQVTTLTDGSSPWSISGSANGANTARAQYSTSSSSGPWSDVSAYDSDFTIASSVSPGAAVTVWVRIQTPTSTTSYAAHASTLKVYAR